MPTVLFLGAGSDIALATAKLFAEKKYDIQLAGRDTAYLEKIKTDLTIRYEIKVSVYYFDALDYDSHSLLIKKLDSLPDITILAFGYLGDQLKGQASWTEAQKIIDSNYTGAVSILNIIAGEYEKNKQGTIVGISSVAGDRGRKSNYLYGSAKAGFTAYLSGLRNRFSKSNVQVITVKPGFVATKMTRDIPLPATLTAQPEQVAQAIFRAVKKRKNTIYSKRLWKYIMLIIRFIPENIFKRMNL